LAIKTDASGPGRRGSRLQGALLGVQVAVCMVLMIAAGLLLRGFRATSDVDPGFGHESVVVASFDLGGAGYDTAAASAFQRQFQERVASLPGVEGVAQAATTPLGEDDFGGSARLPSQERFSRIGYNFVSPDYFSVLGIPIVRGRTFTTAELVDGSPSAIVTETTARRYWPNADPLGQTIVRSGGVGQPSRELVVVGVAADAQVAQIGEIPTDYMYLPATTAQQQGLRLVARTRDDLGAIATAIRAAAAQLDGGLVVRVAPLDANLATSRGLARVVSTLSSSLATLALILAAVGIYGVVAYAVGRRVREIGIRIALGANVRDVLALILRRTMRPVAIGALVGVLVAMGASRVLSSVLFGVSPLDPIGLAGAALFVVFVALAAGLLAARPATRADAMIALRYD
jgi:putative ABC transport system permease protein